MLRMDKVYVIRHKVLVELYVVSESGTKWALEKVDTLRVMPAYP